MPKWEYLVFSGVGAGYFINSQPVQQYGVGQNAPDLYQIINQIGEEGWELVSFHSESGLGTYPSNMWIFKRPKP